MALAGRHPRQGRRRLTSATESSVGAGDRPDAPAPGDGDGRVGPALLLLLVSVPLTAAGNLVAGRYALDSFSPTEANALRYGLALAILAPMLGRWPRPTAQELPALVATGVLGICVYNILFYAALEIIPASEVGLLEMTIPAASLLLAWAFLRERVSGRQVAGIVVSWLGTIWLLQILPTAAANAKSSETWRGELLMLAGVACFAVYAIVSKFAMRRLPPPAVAAYSCLFGVVPLLAAAVPVFVGDPDVLADASIASWLGIAYGAVIGFVFNIIAWYHCFRRVGVARTNIFLYLVPIFGAVLAVPIFDEHLTAWQVFGAGVTLVGVVLATTQGRRRSVPVADALATAPAAPSANGRG